MEQVPKLHLELKEKLQLFESFSEKAKQIICFLQNALNTFPYDKPNPSLIDIENQFPNSAHAIEELYASGMLLSRVHEIDSQVYPDYSKNGSFVECYPKSNSDVDYRMFLTLIIPFQISLPDFLRNAKSLSFKTLFIPIAKEKLLEFQNYNGSDKHELQFFAVELERLIETETSKRKNDYQENIQRAIDNIRQNIKYVNLED
jgi:hypothetical protein